MMLNPQVIVPGETTGRVLYHFTAGVFMPYIRAEGLRNGALPWHRCPETGNPICIRSWRERDCTYRLSNQLRARDLYLQKHARRGATAADKEREAVFPGFQWLTTNPAFDQPFALLGEFPDAKNAFRITVHVPREHLSRLLSWPDLVLRFNPPAAEEINVATSDWQNWLVFNGWIPPNWFLSQERNPGPTPGPTQLLAPQ